MKYRIGLDIGVTSIGWCAMETDEQGEPIRIVDLGARIFEAAEHPKTGAALAEPRRRARGLRRLIRRRAHRVERVKDLLEKTFNEEVVLKIEENKPIDLIKLRVKGLDERLTEEELGRLCIYFVKHRGFSSSKKAGNKEKEEGELLSATKQNSDKIKEGGYRTVGELLSKEYSSVRQGKVFYDYRNKAGEYKNTFLRADLLNEITLILTCQEKNGIISAEFIRKYIDIFTKQRSFDEGPGKGSPYSGTFKIGKCTFEGKNGFERAPKGSYTAEYAAALQSLNNLTLTCRGKKIEITKEQRRIIIEEIRKAKEIDYKKLRKLLNCYDESIRFSALTYSREKLVSEIEKAKFIKMHMSYEIRQALGEEYPIEIYDQVAEIISKVKSLDKQKIEFKKVADFTDEQIQKLGKIDSTKFAHLSIYALNKILPFLEEGYVYSEACEKAGYNHSVIECEKRTLLKGEDITNITNEIGSPVVRRAFSQTIKLLNAIILKYGSPIGVNVEVARELSKDFEERRAIKVSNDERQRENEKIKDKIKAEFGVEAKGLDIIKYRLYEQQSGKCAYSGKDIDARIMMVDQNYVQVDHIIPYSRCFDDGENNKVLVLASENQNKKDRTPYEYFGEDKKRWEEFEKRVETFKCSYKKKQRLLRIDFDEKDERDWKERSLNDTKYVSRLVMNTIRNYLYFEAINGRSKKVWAVSGTITAYLRKMWGLSKIREDGDKHHILDAAVIATTTDAYIQQITKYTQQKERFFARNGEEFIDEETGVVLTKEAYDTLYKKRLDPPYVDFTKELEIRLQPETEEIDLYGNVTKGIRQASLQRLAKMGYTERELASVKPVFVSRMPDRKAKGALHKDTLYSIKFKDRKEGEKIIVKKVDLTTLSLDKEGEIKDYFFLAKKSDPLLYEALKKRLNEYGGDGKKAFQEPFYKPKSDGSQGPLVRKIKIEEKFSIGMELSAKKGYAKNESMVRTDVFFKDGKYYCVPIYVKDVMSGVIPNKAITANKDYSDWKEMDEKDFLFSLYKNDLIYIEMKKPFNLEKANAKSGEEPKKMSAKKCFVYYKGIDSSTGAMSIHTHDNSYKGRVSILSALKVKKFVVDMLGNVGEIKGEKRNTSGVKRKN